MTNHPEKIASALMESIMAAFPTEAAELEDARRGSRCGRAGRRENTRRDRAACQPGESRLWETIRTMLTAEVVEFKRELGIV